jgi:arylsulfatase A-like enzyme
LLNFLIKKYKKNTKKSVEELAFVLLFSFSFLILIGYIANIYWLPERYHWISLLGDGVIVILTFGLGWILYKIRWWRIVYKIALPLIACLIIINLGIFIDRITLNSDRPNVIILGIDTFRGDHASHNGYQRKTCPNIDSIGKKGIVFTNAFSTTSWTLPAFHSILTGLYSRSNGVFMINNSLDKSYITLAELLKNQGYKTAGFISGDFLKSPYGFNQGYDLYNESVSRRAGIESQANITSDKLTKLALPWIRKNQINKFFLFIHYWDPHYDYIPPDPYDTVFDPDYQGTIDGRNFKHSEAIHPQMPKRDFDHIIALYDGEIAWTDKHIGKLLSSLQEWHLDKETIVIVVADHGEGFFDHGQRTHGSTLYNEEIQIPLIFYIPSLELSKTIEHSVSIVDIVPTLCDLLNINHPKGTDGTSLLPIINSNRDWTRGEVYAELWHKLIAVIRDDWKLIHNTKTGEFQLFDLNNDDGEKNNLIQIDTHKAEEMKQMVLNFLQKKKTLAAKSDKTKLDEQTLEQLKSLGYIK